MKTLTTYFFFLICFLYGDIANGQVATWINSVYDAQPIQSTGNQGPYSDGTVVDEAGNTYAAYSAAYDITIGTQVYPAVAGMRNGYVVKYDPDGSVIWVKHIPGTAPYSIGIYEITLDNNSNLYIIGSYQNAVTVDGTMLTNSSNNIDFFLAKWNTAGVMQWAINGGGGATKRALSIDVSNTGSIYVGGHFQGVTSIGSVTLSPTYPGTNFSAFLAKYAPDGTLEWVQRSNNTHVDANSEIFGVQLDGESNIYLHGRYKQTFDWGSISFSHQNPADNWHYWLKCDSTGQPIVKIELAGGGPIITRLAVDNEGYSYLTGHHFGNWSLGATLFNPPSPSGIYSTYLFKLDPNGVVQWVTDLSAYGTGNNLALRDLAMDGIGNLYVTGTYNGNVQIGGQQLPLTSAGPSSVLASFDSYTGTLRWADVIATDQSFMQVVGSNSQGQVAFGGYYRYTGPIGIGSVQTPVQGIINRWQSYLVRVVNSYNTITGEVFLDLNLNSIRDNNEAAIPGGSVVGVTPGPFGFHTSALGEYSAIAGIGTFSLGLPNPPLYHNLLPLGPTTASFTSYGNTVGGRDFALQPIPNQQDLRVNLTPLQPARPGFTTTYRVTYKNMGTVAIPAGQVSLAFDPLFTYLSSTQPAAQAGSTLTWNYSNLLPGQTFNINVLFSLTALAPLGQNISVTASIDPLTGDLTPTDNSESNTRPIVGSYDPNSIEVDYEQLTTQQVQIAQKLNYTIRFQNMGTDTAFTVMLRDSIPAFLLNLGTIEMVSSSHSCTWTLNQSGVLTVLFTSIRLPHQGINSIASNGFVRFQIRPFATLAIGDIIPNKADIYFDYNAPITTNTAETVVVQPSFTTANQLQLPFRVYPNPTQDVFTLAADLAAAGPVIIKLVNMLGQVVHSENLTAQQGKFSHTIRTDKMPTGMYLLQLQTDSGNAVGQVVKQ